MNGSNPGLPLSTDMGEGFILLDSWIFIMYAPVSFSRKVTIGLADEMTVFSLHLHAAAQIPIDCPRGCLFLSRNIEKQMKQE